MRGSVGEPYKAGVQNIPVCANARWGKFFKPGEIFEKLLALESFKPGEIFEKLLALEYFKLGEIFEKLLTLKFSKLGEIFERLFSFFINTK
jgi:hypothetical protein